MNHFIIKHLFLFVLFITISSCGSDDSDTPTIDNENSLILKKISREGEGFEANFNIDGRFAFSEDLHLGKRVKTLEAFYNEKNRLKKIIKRPFNDGEDFQEFFYDKQGKIIKIFVSFNNIQFFQEIETNFIYTDNVITGVSSRDNTNFQYIFTFEDNSLKTLKEYEVINLDAQEIIFKENYLYYSNGNFQKNIIMVGEDDEFNRTITFEYDDKINPYAESHSVNYLNYILNSAAAGTLNRVLFSFSLNNSLTSFAEGYSITLEYNDRGYPIKETSISINNDSYRSVRIFEYY